jgi:hypothetical protein
VQALGRTWRAGAKSKAVERIILAAGTVEENVYRAIKRKIVNLRTLLDDSDLITGL